MGKNNKQYKRTREGTSETIKKHLKGKKKNKFAQKNGKKGNDIYEMKF